MQANNHNIKDSHKRDCKWGKNETFHMGESLTKREENLGTRGRGNSRSLHLTNAIKKPFPLLIHGWRGQVLSWSGNHKTKAPVILVWRAWLPLPTLSIYQLGPKGKKCDCGVMTMRRNCKLVRFYGKKLGPEKRYLFFVARLSSADLVLHCSTSVA